MSTLQAIQALLAHPRANDRVHNVVDGVCRRCFLPPQALAGVPGCMSWAQMMIEGHLAQPPQVLEAQAKAREAEAKVRLAQANAQMQAAARAAAQAAEAKAQATQSATHAQDATSWTGGTDSVFSSLFSCLWHAPTDRPGHAADSSSSITTGTAASLTSSSPAAYASSSSVAASSAASISAPSLISAEPPSPASATLRWRGARSASSRQQQHQDLSAPSSEPTMEDESQPLLRPEHSLFLLSRLIRTMRVQHMPTAASSATAATTASSPHLAASTTAAIVVPAASTRRTAFALVALAVALLIAQWIGGGSSSAERDRSAHSTASQFSAAPHSAASNHDRQAPESDANCRLPSSGPGVDLASLAQGRRVLVTGVGGFIGSAVAQSCLDLGMEVVGVDDLSGGYLDNVPSGVRFVRADLTDPEAVSALFREQGPFHTIYHLAAYAAEGMSHFIRAYNYRTNLGASVLLLNAALLTNMSRMVFTSSIAVYGASTPPPFRESQAPSPEDPYAISKFAFELDLAAASRVFPGFSFVVFRPHNVYGPRQNLRDPHRNVVGLFLKAMAAGSPMRIFGSGLQSRCFSFINDVAPVIAAGGVLPAAANRIYNLGSDQSSSLLEVAKAVRDAWVASSSSSAAHAAAAAEAAPLADFLEFLPPRIEVDHACSAHQRVRCDFGLPPRDTPLDEGLRRTVQWVRQQQLQSQAQAASTVPGESVPSSPSSTPQSAATAASPPAARSSSAPFGAPLPSPFRVEVLLQMPPSWITPQMQQEHDDRLRSMPVQP